MALYKEKRTKFYYKHGKETHIIICFDSRTQIYKGNLSYNHGMEIYKTNNEESRIYKNVCQKYFRGINNRRGRRKFKELLCGKSNSK